MTCREYLGQEHGYCNQPALAPDGWCLEHTAARQLWEQQMAKRGASA